MDASGLDEEALATRSARRRRAAAGRGPPARGGGRHGGRRGRASRSGSSPTDAKLIGVTHAADLPVVSAELARQVASGIRAPRVWDSVER